MTSLRTLWLASLNVSAVDCAAGVLHPRAQTLAAVMEGMGPGRGERFVEDFRGMVAGVVERRDAYGRVVWQATLGPCARTAPPGSIGFWIAARHVPTTRTFSSLATCAAQVGRGLCVSIHWHPALFLYTPPDMTACLRQ